MTHYAPSDGDYIDADYTKFFNDAQAKAGYEIGEYLEICATFDFENNTVHVDGANDKGTEWIWSWDFPIPKGWNVELVKKMFGGHVYLQPNT